MGGGHIKDRSSVSNTQRQDQLPGGAKDTCRGGQVMRLQSGWRHEALGASIRPLRGHWRTVTPPILFRKQTNGSGCWGERGTQAQQHRLLTVLQKPLLSPFHSLTKA